MSFGKFRAFSLTMNYIPLLFKFLFIQSKFSGSKTNWDSPFRLHNPKNELVVYLFLLRRQRDLLQLGLYDWKISLLELVTWSARFSVFYESHFLQFFARQVEHRQMQKAFLEKFWDFDATLLRLRKPNRKMFHLKKYFLNAQNFSKLAPNSNTGCKMVHRL